MPDSRTQPFHIIPGLDGPIGNADFSKPLDIVIEFNGFPGFGDHVDPFGP